MTTDQEDLLALWNACGYHRLAGMHVVRADDAGSRMEVDVGVQHLDVHGTAHGGVTGGLLEAAMGLAVLAVVPPEEGCATVSTSVTYTARTRPGAVAAEGRVLHLGCRLVTASAEARDAEGALLAVAQGTFRRVPIAASPPT